MYITICGTGHRPHKLGGYSEDVLEKLTTLAVNFIEPYQPSCIISGMALGWDTALALAAIKCNIPLLAAIPCDGQEKLWPQKSQDTYNYILSEAFKVHVVSPGPYEKKKMDIRNKWMVDHSEMVLALWDGTKGGTYNCIQYTKKKHKPIKNLYPEWVQLNNQ